MAISKRNIKLESISTDDFNDLSQKSKSEKNISEQDKGFILRFHDENTNDYFDKDIEINKSELLSYVIINHHLIYNKKEKYNLFRTQLIKQY